MNSFIYSLFIILNQDVTDKQIVDIISQKFSPKKGDGSFAKTEQKLEKIIEQNFGTKRKTINAKKNDVKIYCMFVLRSDLVLWLTVWI